MRAVCKGRQMPLDEIQKTVLESVENFARGARQADDLTILLVRFRAAGTGSAIRTSTAIEPPPQIHKSPNRSFRSYHG